MLFNSSSSTSKVVIDLMLIFLPPIEETTQFIFLRLIFNSLDKFKNAETQ